MIPWVLVGLTGRKAGRQTGGQADRPDRQTGSCGQLEKQLNLVRDTKTARPSPFYSPRV